MNQKKKQINETLNLEDVLEELDHGALDIEISTAVKPLASTEEKLNEKFKSTNSAIAIDEDPAAEIKTELSEDIIDVAQTDPLKEVKVYEFTLEQQQRQQAIIQAGLFISGTEGINIHDLKRMLFEFELDSVYIHNFIRQLAIEAQNDPACGLLIQKIGDSYKYYTKKDLTLPLSKVVRVQLKSALTPALLEILAIVAYNEPCPKGLIEKIRNVDATNGISRLIDLELVYRYKQAETIGRPWLYKVTQKFYDIFGIKSLQQLPKFNANLESLLQDQESSDKKDSFFNINRSVNQNVEEALSGDDDMNFDNMEEMLE